MEKGLLFQGFEWYLEDNGKYYKDMILKIFDLKKLGVTAVWLPPVTKATGTNDTGYGLYDLWDLGEFDQKGSVRTKYGKKDELQKLISKLQENSIAVYADVVINHKAGADFPEKFNVIKVDPNNRTTIKSEEYEIEGWTGFDFANRKGKYSDFKWNHNHFTGVDFDNINKEKGVFKILGDNKGWSHGVSNEKGNFDYLMFADIDLAHPDVVKELKDWIIWFIKELNLDGLRFDAVKHIDSSFMNNFISFINEYTNDNFYMLAEYWENDAKEIQEYLKDLDYSLPLFDVVLHYNFKEAATNKHYDLRKIFDNSLVLSNPTLAVTFVDNHDSQPGQSLESFVDDWFKEIAYALILLRKDGYPCIFYGDYYGIKDNNAVTSFKSKINILASIRNKYAYGEQDDYFESKDLIGWVRRGNKDYPEKAAILISTSGTNALKMFVGLEEAGNKYYDYTNNNQSEVVIDAKGYGDFKVSSASVSVWIKSGLNI